MVDELAEVLKRFALSEKECGEVSLDGEDFESGLEDCSRSLIGKVLGSKAANFTGVKNVVNQLWNWPRKMEAVEIGPNLFQFIFGSEEEADRVMRGKPYLIDNQILNVKRWREGIDRDPRAFDIAPLWVQIWGLPIHCITQDIGRKIGSIFVEVKEVLLAQTGSKEGKHIKALCEMDTTQPMLRGTTVILQGKRCWVDFRYEKSPDFCYNCGIIGHGEKNCNIEVEDMHHGTKKQYGVWMRAQGLRLSPRKNLGPRFEKSSNGAGNSNQSPPRHAQNQNEQITGNSNLSPPGHAKNQKVQTTAREKGLCKLTNLVAAEFQLKVRQLEDFNPPSPPNSMVDVQQSKDPEQDMEIGEMKGDNTPQAMSEDRGQELISHDLIHEFQVPMQGTGGNNGNKEGLKLAVNTLNAKDAQKREPLGNEGKEKNKGRGRGSNKGVTRISQRMYSRKPLGELNSNSPKLLTCTKRKLLEDKDTWSEDMQVDETCGKKARTELELDQVKTGMVEETSLNWSPSSK